MVAILITILVLELRPPAGHHLADILDEKGRLLWLSLTPIATAWLGEVGVEPGPVAAYAIVLLGCAGAYTLLTLSLLASHEPGSTLAQAIGSDGKGKVSLAAYVVAFVCSFAVPWVSVALFVGVAIVWFIPDRRIERVIVNK